MTDENNVEMKKAKIFLIDDDSFLLDMYSMKFEKCGYDVKVFTKAQECLDMLKEGNNPDVLLCDIIMPGMDGWAFLKEVRGNNLASQAKIVILSNQGEEEEKEHAKEFKIDGFIVKALSTPSEVVSKIEEYIKK